MPNRILRGQSLTSPTLDKLSDAGERLFFRLVLVADDYGRFESDARVVAAKCYPLRAMGMDIDYIKTHYAELEHADLVRSYSVNGRKYGHFPTWGDHQRIRSSRSKYPPPEQNVDKSPRTALVGLNGPSVGKHDTEPEATAPNADTPNTSNFAAGCGNLRQLAARARARPESESESETKAIKSRGELPHTAAERHGEEPDPNPPAWLNDQESEELKKILPVVMESNRSTFPKIQNLIRHWMQIRPPWPVCQTILEHIRDYKPENPGGYAHKILAIEEGNYHAAQAVARHAAIKEAERIPAPIVQIDHGMQHVGEIKILQSLTQRAQEAQDENAG